MSPEKQRVAIAEACGWTWGIKMWHSPRGEWGELVSLPDYLNDLNATHEAEKTLDSNGLISDRNIYAHKLRLIVHPEPHMNNDWLGWCLVHSTSSQRAEAFLKTIGKWEE